jgi:flagellar motility protein MotE (MotC chaperone)
MSTNNENQVQTWLQTLKAGLSNPKSIIGNTSQLFNNEDERDKSPEKEKVEIDNDITNIIDAKRIERLNVEAEAERKRKQLADKEKAEHEKKINALRKKENAQKKQFENRTKEFENSLLKNGIRGYKSPQFIEQLGLVLAETNRKMMSIFDNSGNMIISGDKIEFGDSGLFYVVDYLLNFNNLYHFDSIKGNVEFLAKFDSFIDLQKAIYKQDPQKKLGFYLFMDYNTQKEADEEIRVSKLTLAERLKEEKERKKIETDAKKAQKKLEKEKLQKAKSTRLSIDEEIEKLFGK